jgi:uncharacterized protein (DUF433 family)
MTAILEQVDKLLPQMSRSEKTQLHEWLSSELSGVFPGIEKTAGICDGDARVAGTRIPVWSLVNSWREGYSDAELLEELPSLKQTDLENARLYFRANQAEIELQIVQNDEA